MTSNPAQPDRAIDANGGATDPAPATIEFNGLPALHLQAGDGAQAVVMLHGAHLVSWLPAGGSEQLYLSPLAEFDGANPIRGGVPVVFPQFDLSGPLLKHGFARTRSWLPLRLEQGADYSLAVLRLTDDDETLSIWPHQFVAELSVQVAGSRLDIELAIENSAANPVAGAETSAAPFRFTSALHTYLRVDDASAVSLEGLHRLRYFDKVRGTEQIDSAQQLRADGELDRIYFDAARPLQLRDGARHLEVASQGFADVVVWNPGRQRAAMLSDLPDDGWREMFCVEAAAIGKPVELAPGDCWIGRQTIDLSR